MAFTFAEGLVDEIIAYLEDNLPAKLATITIQLADGIILAEPVEYLRREPGGIRAITNIPSVFVIVPRYEIQNWHETDADQMHNLWIYLVDVATNPETLRKRLYRYGRAIWETLVDHRFDATTVPTWKLGGGERPVVDFGAALVGPQTQAMADVKLELVYEKLETE